MRRQERKRSLVVALLVAAAAATAMSEPAARAQAPASIEQAGTVARKNAITVEGGYRAAVFGLDAEIQTRVGPFLAIGPGLVRGGYSLAAHAGYDMPLYRYWSLRPGIRVNRSWRTTDDCRPDSCTFDFIVLDLGVRYRGPTGLVFETGLPVVAWLPLTPTGSGTWVPIKAYTFPTTSLVWAISVGYSFDL
jgi:hypothetical protein